MRVCYGQSLTSLRERDLVFILVLPGNTRDKSPLEQMEKDVILRLTHNFLFTRFM